MTPPADADSAPGGFPSDFCSFCAAPVYVRVEYPLGVGRGQPTVRTNCCTNPRCKSRRPATAAVV